MTIEVWLAYVTAFALLSLIPGPSVFMVIGQSLCRDIGAAFYCIAGDLLGGVVMMTIACIGLGTVLAASSGAYLLIKWTAWPKWPGSGFPRYLQRAAWSTPMRIRAGEFTNLKSALLSCRERLRLIPTALSYMAVWHDVGPYGPIRRSHRQSGNRNPFQSIGPEHLLSFFRPCSGALHGRSI